MSARRILYIDDEGPLRDLVRAYLGMEGYAISTAAGGEEAIGILGREAFDLILLDYHMPGVSGLEVLQFLREKECVTRVVVLSGDDGPEVARACEEFGVVARLSKPFDIATLLGLLES